MHMVFKMSIGNLEEDVNVSERVSLLCILWHLMNPIIPEDMDFNQDPPLLPYYFMDMHDNCLNFMVNVWMESTPLHVSSGCDIF